MRDNRPSTKPGGIHIAVVGTGMAGAHAAASRRGGGFDGSVTLLGDESLHPYDHVPLSKEFLSGGGE